MYKLLQILRASRLILLIILLMITIISQLARAENGILYYAGGIKTGYHASAQAACAAELPGSTPRPAANSDGRYGRCYKQSTGEYVPDVAYSSISHTCEAKELTNNGASDGVSTPSPEIFWLRAPSGTKAGDWYSDRFNSCENNCIVLNTRHYGFDPDNPLPRDFTEDDGTSRSMFRKKQTGKVCVPEKPKKDDPPKPPKPADDDKPDSKQPDNGKSDGDTGSDTGDGQSSKDQSGSDSGKGKDKGADSGQNDGSNSSDQNSGNDSSGGGSGGKGGGSSGGGGYTGVPGASPGGSGNGAGKDDGSEGGTDGQGNGKSDGSGEGSDDSGKGSDQKSGDGAVDGDKDGKGDGEGSISGGNCAAEQAPSCKGDPIQCYIAVEQWRTACATAGKQSEITSGNCKTNTPPECKGDATQCYISRQQFYAGCEAQAQRTERDGLKAYADGKSGIVSEVEGASADGVDSAIKGNSSSFDLSDIIDRSGFGWSRACPASASVDIGIFGTFDIDYSMLCTMAQILGNVFAVMSMLFAVRYIFAG